jgi:thiol-disulfide isomerase/thioredoxin
MPSPTSTRLTGRWAAALVVAALIASWPACAPGGTRPKDGKLANLRFTLKDMHGKAVNLEETFKGKALLLNFWATWCTPCKYEIPMLVELQEKYQDKGFTVVGITTDDPPDQDLRTFAATYKINYPVLSALGQDAVQEAYEASITIPVSWFIRPDGTVLLKHEGIQKKEWFEQQILQILPAASVAHEAGRD